MRCRVCDSDQTRFLANTQDTNGDQNWYRCLSCRSDSSDTSVENAQAFYRSMSSKGILDSEFGGDRSRLIESMTNNFNWFMKYPTPALTFLDIGSNAGCGMDGMAERGWDSHGFEVCPVDQVNVITAEQFKASLFPERFGAVMVREVIEHVADWKDLLNEVFNCLLPGGLFQIQTPRPTSISERMVYQYLHLTVFSVRMLQLECLKAGFELIASEVWHIGQLHMLRKP